MKRQKQEYEVTSSTITQEEAVRMIELWTREDRLGREGIGLCDVAEALGISQEEALRLLAQVRRGATAPKRESSARSTLLLPVMLVPTLLLAAATVYGEGAHVLRGDFMSEANWLALIVASIWLTAWSFYYRRPLSRAFGRFARGFEGFVQGKS